LAQQDQEQANSQFPIPNSQPMGIENWELRIGQLFVFVPLWLSLVFLSACGKVGDPQPPYIRIPEAVRDLAATQAGHDIIITWTNPPRNVDGSVATNLAHVRIRVNGAPLVTLNVNGAGQAQSHTIPVGSIADRARSFNLTVDTAQGKTSDPSNTASITPVEVPGAVLRLRAMTDQRKIIVEWNKPEDHGELADAYIVTRTDVPGESKLVEETRFEDSQYQPMMAYTYQVTPVRRLGARTVSGVGPEQRMITAEDKTPPQVPTGLALFPIDSGAILTWDANTELDLAGYRVFRKDRGAADFKPVTDRLITTNKLDDGAYRPGVVYAVTAVDESKNESPRSAAFPAP
jgi:fibronectin type 3 domain-containing protein